MTKSTRDLLELAMRLTAKERIELAESLYESVPDEDLSPSAEWLAEIERRVEQLESGQAGPGVPWEEAMARVERELEEHRKKRGQAPPAR